MNDNYNNAIKNILSDLEKKPHKYCYNLEENETIDFPIFRIIPMDIFLEMLVNNKITLVQTSLWDDVYENIFLKSQINHGKDKFTLLEYANDFYGQSWSTVDESDALWRIYSNDKKRYQSANNT